MVLMSRTSVYVWCFLSCVACVGHASEVPTCSADSTPWKEAIDETEPAIQMLQRKALSSRLAEFTVVGVNQTSGCTATFKVQTSDSVGTEATASRSGYHVGDMAADQNILSLAGGVKSLKLTGCCEVTVFTKLNYQGKSKVYKQGAHTDIEGPINSVRLTPAICMHSDIRCLSAEGKQVENMSRGEVECHYRCNPAASSSGLQLAHKHMSKCGGTTLLHVFPEMTATSGHDSCELGELSPLTEGMSENHYFVAGVRNPCDYYVSLWAYQHGKPWAEKQNEECDCFDLADSSHGDVEKFHKWLAWVLRGDHGPMTYRFWEALVAKNDGLACHGGSLPTCYLSFNDSQVENSLSAGKFPPETIDCWASLEDFEGELKSCLETYEKKSGVALSWKAFDKYMKKPENSASRKTCEEYYTPELASLVMEKDKHIFDGFGYSTCCGARDTH